MDVGTGPGGPNCPGPIGGPAMEDGGSPFIEEGGIGCGWPPIDGGGTPIEGGGTPIEGGGGPCMDEGGSGGLEGIIPPETGGMPGMATLGIPCGGPGDRCIALCIGGWPGCGGKPCPPGAELGGNWFCILVAGPGPILTGGTPW